MLKVSKWLNAGIWQVSNRAERAPHRTVPHRIASHHQPPGGAPSARSLICATAPATAGTHGSQVMLISGQLEKQSKLIVGSKNAKQRSLVPC